LKTRDRASALDTAAAMPSLINSEIRINRGSYIVNRVSWQRPWALSL
jgi:hypothetical protein